MTIQFSGQKSDVKPMARFPLQELPKAAIF
jgi:hypothetical protein